MKHFNLTYIGLVIIHIILGILIFLSKSIGLVYGLLMLVISFFIIIKSHNAKNQVLYVAAYAVGSEVILRMTGSVTLYEIGKYSVIVYMLFGFYFSGFSKNSFLYWIFLLLLVPGIIIGVTALNLESDVRRSLAFNISGPICLGISAIYCYQRNISQKEIDTLLLCLLFPLITTVTYLFLYTPNIRDVITSTQSNFETSGGFGPNQVSTVLGLGMFLIFIRLLFYSKQKLILILNLLLLFIITFRGIITFSRGGMITALVMIVLLLSILFFVIRDGAKFKLMRSIVFLGVLFGIVWGYSSLETNGFIDKRYANKDAAGRTKASLLTGRENIIATELDIFLANPFLGVGVGKAEESRLASTGDNVATHNEITRMLAEHGLFGIIGLLILFVCPIALYINNKQHIYLLSFFAFWILTINHAAMRLAAPGFIYALSLLHVTNISNKKSVISEEITIDY